MTDDQFVYDLEIEDTHCYFADGVLVSNCHEEKSAETAQGNALGKLAAACKHTIALTGTLIGGHAEHIRPLLFRLAPKTLLAENLGWSDSLEFSERYGRIETTIIDKVSKSDAGDEDNKQSCGKRSRRTHRQVKPGIVPTLFGRHLLDKAVFLTLSDLADNLPPNPEIRIPVAMDAETAAEYRVIENDLMKEIRKMVIKGDKRLLGVMLQTLLAYPDMPYGWKPVGYMDQKSDTFIPVAAPTNLSPKTIRPKEKALVDFVLSEVQSGRKVWVYVQYTDKHDVQARLERLLTDAGLRVGSLRAAVEPAKREAWIAKHGPTCDVMISFPKLVEVGLDFFDAAKTYNFCTLAFYETGYNLFTLRQAGARAWRIGQDRPCKVAYFYYSGSMQERAIALMAKKMSAAQALEGKFTTEGLVELAGDDGDEMALAKSMFERLDGAVMERAWGKLQLDGVKEEVAKRGLTGADLVKRMRSAKVTIAGLAAKAGVPEKRVREARKDGLSVDDSKEWEAHLPVTAKVAGRRRVAAERVTGMAARTEPQKRAGVDDMMPGEGGGQ